MSKQLLITIALVSFFSAFMLAQEQTDKQEKKECAKGCCSGHESETMTMAHMEMDSTKSGHKHMDMKDHKNMKMDSSKTNKESWVREGEIDLKAIDKNKDGKVFQDMMDWNVISDEAGECPLCGMKLKEVTIEKAKENLVKHNFKVKE